MNQWGEPFRETSKIESMRESSAEGAKYHVVEEIVGGI